MEGVPWDIAGKVVLFLGGIITAIVGAYVAQTRRFFGDGLRRAEKTGEALGEKLSEGAQTAHARIDAVERKFESKFGDLSQTMREDVTDLERGMSEKFSRLDVRVARMEEFLEHAPSRKDFQSLERRVSDQGGDIKAINTSLRGMNNSLINIESFLLKQAGNGGTD